MRSHEADCRLEYARLHPAMGEKDKARESLAKAKELIDKRKMPRWDFEVREMAAQIGQEP